MICAIQVPAAWRSGQQAGSGGHARGCPHSPRVVPSEDADWLMLRNTRGRCIAEQILVRRFIRGQRDPARAATPARSTTSFGTDRSDQRKPIVILIQLGPTSFLRRHTLRETPRRSRHSPRGNTWTFVTCRRRRRRGARHAFGRQPPWSCSPAVLLTAGGVARMVPPGSQPADDSSRRPRPQIE